MKPRVAISMPALILVPAMAFAETSPSGSTTTHMNSKPSSTVESSADKGGQKFYPDWPAVKKIEGASQKGASEAPQAGQTDSNKQSSGSMSASPDSQSSSKDRPGLVEKAEKLIGAITGRSTTSNESEAAAGEPRILGTINGVIEFATSNQSTTNDAAATTAAALQGRTSIPITIKGELKIDKSMNSNEGSSNTSSR